MIAVLLDEKNVKGVSYHRLYVPFKNLQGKGYDVKFFENLSDLTTQELRDCRAVVISRGFVPKYGVEKLRDELHRNGILLVIDQDDWWTLDNWHPMIEVFNTQNKRQHIVDSIVYSDFVTVTHKKLAKKVSKLNKKARSVIIPNAIDSSDTQWRYNRQESDKVRFGYIAGASHIRDVEELGGYNFKAEGKELVVADVQDYKTQLGATTVLEPLDVFNYAKLYDSVDISIAPLKSTEFNKMKSELKILEAGFKKCAFIGSNIHPYSNLIQNGVNGILCSNEREWREAIEGMTKEKAKEMGERLYQDVQQFEINNVNKIREKFFFG